LHQNDAHSHVYSYYSWSLTTIIQRLTRCHLTSDNCRNTNKLDEEGEHVGALCPDLTPTLIIEKPDAAPSHPTANRSSDESGRPSTCTITHAPEVATANFRRPIIWIWINELTLSGLPSLAPYIAPTAPTPCEWSLHLPDIFP
jgi:hypothetical protein